MDSKPRIATDGEIERILRNRARGLSKRLTLHVSTMDDSELVLTFRMIRREMLRRPATRSLAQ